MKFYFYDFLCYILRRLQKYFLCCSSNPIPEGGKRLLACLLLPLSLFSFSVSLLTFCSIPASSSAASEGSPFLPLPSANQISHETEVEEEEEREEMQRKRTKDI